MRWARVKAIGFIIWHRKNFRSYFGGCYWLKKKDDLGEFALERKQWKSCCDGGSLPSNLRPTDAKCLFRILGIFEGSLVILLFSGFLILVRQLGDFDFLDKTRFIPSHVFFIFVILSSKYLCSLLRQHQNLTDDWAFVPARSTRTELCSLARGRIKCKQLMA